MIYIEDLIEERRSVRKYTNEPIDLATIRDVLRLATYAPSASNIQPWIFGVITEPFLIQMLEGFSPGMPRGSNAVIVVCSDHKLAAERGGNDRLCTLDCAFAGQIILLTAFKQGIGSCVVCSFDREAVSSILELPHNVHIEYLITLGYFASLPKTPLRKPVDERIFIDCWNKK